MVAANAINFEDAVTTTGQGRFNVFLLLAVGLSLMCVIIETQGVMFIVPASKCDLNLDVTEKGLLSSINYLGVFASSHLWGFLADTSGRRRVILVSLCCSMVTSFLSSLIPISWLFILFRFFTGFFIGGSSAVIYAYAGEFNDAKHRPQVVSWITTFVALGTLILPGMAWPILTSTWSVDLYFVTFRPWRLMIIVYSLPTLLSAFCIYNLPESPKYLLSQEKHDEALDVLRKMYAMNSGKNPDEFPVKAIELDEDNSSVGVKGTNLVQIIWQQTVPLFKKPFLKQTLMVCTMHLGIFVVCGVLMWYPEILIELQTYVIDHVGDEPTLCMAVGYYLENTSSVLSLNTTTCNDTIDMNVFITSMYISAALGVTFIACGILINSLGKKTLLYIFLALGVGSSIVGQLIANTTVIQIMLGALILSGVSVSVVNAIIVDLYPTKIRAMALAISLMFGRIGAFTGANVTGPMLYGFCDYILYVFGAICLALIIIVILLPSPPTRETRIIKPV